MSPAREFHGRDAELALIRGELERLSDGAETVVVVEGAAGMGKSRLLAEVAAIARSLGIRVGHSAADPGETVVELAALLSALLDGAEPLIDPGELSPLHAQPEQRFWLLRDLQQLLERAALESPLLISIDDAHWADGGTVTALRTLPTRLLGLPIAWVIAFRPPREATPLVRALEQLKREGARTIALGPIDDDAVAQLAADILAAQPDQSILKQVAEADGSPFLVVETLLGLREEGQFRVVDGRAELIDGQLPRRVHEKMRERLGRLSDEASDAVTVAASLGRTFTFDELARTLGRPASELLAPVGELLEANLLIERDENLGFWHDITREAVRASVPVTARRALDRQAAVVLLEAGALPVEVAVQLAASAEIGDEVAIATLLDAAKALVTTDPGTAAQFGQRALEIAPAHHPQRGEIVGTTAIALHIAGDSEQAIAFADRALREILPALQEAEVRLSIAGMFAISPEIRIGAGRLALSLPDLPETLRARQLACLFHNLVTAGRLDEARAVLEDIADEVLLARIALATEDDALGQLARSNSRRRAERNPAVASIAATAAHVRGLLDRSHADLRGAVAVFERTPRRLELAAALEDLGAELTATDRDAAIDVLGRTLALYTELGASWDARRVRSRLRELGVRRRLVTAEPEARGWAAMTTAELAVARLVAEGLTNREVAERLFISPHTVNSHLRHVFTKLGINSRVELARLARDYEMA